MTKGIKDTLETNEKYCPECGGVIMSVMGTLKLQGKDFFEEGRELLMNQRT